MATSGWACGALGDLADPADLERPHVEVTIAGEGCTSIPTRPAPSPPLSCGPPPTQGIPPTCTAR
jgi:hypothetical protein